MDDTIFIVQPYIAKIRGLVAQPAQVFGDEASARRAANRLKRFRAGIVVLSQFIDPVTAAKGRPVTLAMHGNVPEAWGTTLSKAA